MLRQLQVKPYPLQGHDRGLEFISADSGWDAQGTYWSRPDIYKQQPVTLMCKSTGDYIQPRLKSVDEENRR